MNADLQSRVDDSWGARRHGELFDSTEMGTLFLDDEMRCAASQAVPQALQADPGRRWAAADPYLERPALPRAGRGCGRGAAYARLFGKAVPTKRRALVPGAHHALPDRGKTSSTAWSSPLSTSPSPRRWKPSCARLQKPPRRGKRASGEQPEERGPPGTAGRSAPAGGSSDSGKRERRSTGAPGFVAGRDAAAVPRTAGPPDRAGDSERGTEPGAGGTRSLPRPVFRPLRSGAGRSISPSANTGRSSRPISPPRRCSASTGAPCSPGR